MTPLDDSDTDVIARSHHDPSCFGVVFDRHAVSVHRYLERRLGRDRADDLLGEVFRIAFERRHDYRPDHGDARPWLFGIASNLVLKAYRHEARHLRALSRLPALAGAPDPALTRVEEVIDARDDAAKVVDALLGLNPRDRDVVLLVAWEGFSYDDVAAALDIPVGTVRSRLNRARRIIRERAGSYGNELKVIRLPQTPRKAVGE